MLSHQTFRRTVVSFDVLPMMARACGGSRLFSGAVPPPPGGAGMPPSPPPGDSPFIVDVTSKTFEAEVLKSPIPVVLDVWAGWCGPCKQLTPVLESTVMSAQGRLKLAKVDADAEPELSGALQVKSLPSVFGLNAGKLVDQFVGVPQPQRLQEFFTKLMEAAAAAASPAKLAEDQLEHAFRLLDDKDFTTALEVLSSTLGLVATETGEPADTIKAKASAGVLLAHVGAGDMEQATAAADAVTAMKNHQSVLEVTQALAAFKLMALGGGGGDSADGGSADGDLGGLKAAFDAAPDSPDAQFALAQGLLSAGQHEDAIKLLVSHIGKFGADHNDSEARTLLFTVFDSLGASNPIVKDGRRELAKIMFR